MCRCVHVHTYTWTQTCIHALTYLDCTAQVSDSILLSIVFYVRKVNWGTGCVGRVGPEKDSLTYMYHHGSQGWAPRVLPLSFCLYVSYAVVCTCCVVVYVFICGVVGVLSFLARML